MVVTWIDWSVVVFVVVISIAAGMAVSDFRRVMAP